MVGPAIFVLNTMPEMAKPVVEARTQEPIQPEEVWIDIHHTWVRLDGTRISGWLDGQYFAFRPSLLNRWKIRQAARRWQRSHPSDTAGNEA